MMRINPIQAYSHQRKATPYQGSSTQTQPALSFGTNTTVSEPSTWDKVVTLAKDYGPYAIMGSFFGAIGLAGVAFTDNYLDWLKEGHFPIEKWPNTASAIIEQHHHSGGSAEHATHSDHTGHAHDTAASSSKGHVHADGSVCTDPTQHAANHAPKKGIMSAFADPEAPSLTDRAQDDEIRKLKEAVESLRKTPDTVVGKP